MDAELPQQLRRSFSDAQIVELTLDVVAWNQQKILVALGVDRAVDEHLLTPLSFDAAGHSVIGPDAG
jgi:hypothetical protein